MLQRYSTKCVRIYDSALFTGFAQTLAKWFGRVEYFSEWKSEFPFDVDRYIGKGLPGVTRIDDFFDGLDSVDLFVFPDCLHGDLQAHLESLGHRVFGARYGENLELFRDWSKKKCKEMGIDIGPYEVIKGTDNLRKFLKEHDDRWIKVDCRGSMETWHSQSLQLSEDRLTQLESDLGSALKNAVEFVVEEPIPLDEEAGEAETGYDGLSIDGRYPESAFFGIEVKGKAFAGAVVRYEKLPERLRTINDKLVPFLKKSKYRMFLSTEERDGKLTDPCCRLPSPPNELYQIMISNLPDVLWYGAEGRLVEPIYEAKYGGLVRIYSDWANQKKTQPISWPKKYDGNVILRKHCRIDGDYFVLPKGANTGTVGSIVSMGDDWEAIQDELAEISKQIKGHDLETKIDEFPNAEAKLKQLLKERNR